MPRACRLRDADSREPLAPDLIQTARHLAASLAAEWQRRITSLIAPRALLPDLRSAASERQGTTVAIRDYRSPRSRQSRERDLPVR